MLIYYIIIYIYIYLRVSYFFLGQSIRIDETNALQLKFVSSMKIVGATGLGRYVGFRVGVSNSFFLSIDRY